MTEGLAVEASRGSLPDPLGAQDAQRSSPHEAGDLIGAFRILERIDEGVEATLFRVERVTRPRMPPAAHQGQRGVLVLTSSPRGRVDPDRFAEQTRRLAGVDHRSLARPRHGGVTSDGRVWVVYDEIAGEALEEYCDARELTLERRVRWMVDVLEALARAHAQLVLHCFLSPELLRVVEGEDGPRVVVLGFGLHGLAGSRLVGGEGSEGSQEAPPSGLASPEEVLGQPRCTASDVYRVGLELQRLLLGARPEDEVRREDPESWVHAMVERSMIDPAERLGAQPYEEQQQIAAARGTSPRALIERLRGELGDLLLSTLAEEATERPRSADAVALRLERWLDGGGSDGVRRERRLGRALPALLVVALLLAGWWAIESWRRAVRAGEAVRLAAAVDLAVTEGLGSSPWPERLDPAELLPPELGRRLQDADPGFAVELLGRSAEIAARHGDRERATALHARAVEHAAVAFGTRSPEVAASRLRQARTAISLGLEDAGQAAREALAAVRASRRTGKPALLEARLLVAEALAELEPDEALALAEELVAELEAPGGWWRALMPDPWSAAERDRLLLRAHLVRGRALLGAQRFAESAAALAEAARGPLAAREPQLASEAWRFAALATESAGEPAAERADSLERALRARIEAAGERDPAAIDLAEKLASVLAADGRLEGAIARAARSAEVAAEPRRRAGSWEQVGRWQLEAGRPAEAARSFDSAFVLLDAGSPDAHRVAVERIDARLRSGDVAGADAALAELPPVAGPDAEASVRVARARVLASLGRAEAAVALREALDALRVAGSGESPTAVPALLALGEMLVADGDAIVAEAYFRRALSILGSSSAPAYRMAEARSALGEALLVQGRREEAEDLLRESAGDLAGRDDVPAREARRRLGLLGAAAAGS